MSLFDDLVTLENLNYAWKKARTLFSQADGYVDNAEITAFELNLANELAQIQEGFRSLSYTLRPLRPLPRPKKLDNGKPVDRQYFHTSVQDQVAWIALTNILGPRLDPLMPAWSYGNRIYRAAWFADDEDRRSRKLEIGPYRHASGHLYRKFQHSWPLFRRHVARTARLMAGIRFESSLVTEEDEAEERAFIIGKVDDLAYFRPKFWKKPKTIDKQELFHASIDLEKFFPSISRVAIRKALIANLRGSDYSAFDVLISRMLSFEVSYEGIPSQILTEVVPQFEEFDGDNGIPTGLFAAGFLANAALLPIDQKVEKLLEKDRTVAHFRYVDDHTIIAYGFDDLCNWIKQYRRLLDDSGIGATVNEEKFDPKSLGRYLLSSVTGSSEQKAKEQEEAENDTRIDGSNPTKLLTKTLGQVSAIAAGNVHIMDDDDLKERLKLLEWLLLADIPEREIRPDTRAAFAAGQIAMLVPLIVQAGDGLIDKAREVADLGRELKGLRKSGVPESKLKEIVFQIKAAQRELKQKETEHRKREKAQYRHCFDLLMQSFKEFPGKPRLFYRLYHYCLLTGHLGIREVAAWITEQRKRNNVAWADYYAGLSLQILADTLFRAARTLGNSNALLSDQDAARAHIQDIASLDETVFVVPFERTAWFHEVGRRELFASLIAVGAQYSALNDGTLGQKLYQTAGRLNRSTAQSDTPGAFWRTRTGWPAGIWAEFAEQKLSLDGHPSATRTQLFLSALDIREVYDVLAMRRYPELLPTEWWRGYLSAPQGIILTDDAGWWREAIEAHPGWEIEAQISSHEAIRSAGSSLNTTSIVGQASSQQSSYAALPTWLDFVKKLSPFDPRRSEWTALEVLRGLLITIKNDLFASSDILDHLHPANVLISESWFKELEFIPSWEKWRTQVGTSLAIMRDPESRIADYRFSVSIADSRADGWLGHRVGIGRILLGLLRLDFRGPRIWNIRGNEHAQPLARRAAYERLAISSQTLQILEGCLSARSMENFRLRVQPGLFGEDHPLILRDINFDAPPLNDPDAVVESIDQAQAILVRNQIVVSGNQPRQLIPFRIEDFALGETSSQRGDGDAE